MIDVRYLTLGIGLTMSACAGTLYAFSAWNTQMKDQLQFSGKEISLVYSLGAV
jgi:hypothetical protein